MMGWTRWYGTVARFGCVLCGAIGARSTIELDGRLSRKTGHFDHALRRIPMLESVRGRMPATSLVGGQSFLVDHPTLRRTRPLERGFECDVKEEMYRGLASADMMAALGGGLIGLTAARLAIQNQEMHLSGGGCAFRSGRSTPAAK